MQDMSEPAATYATGAETAPRDPMTAAVAAAVGMRYEEAAVAVRQHREGFRHLPGTRYYTAVACWLAVTEYVKITGGG